MEILQPMSVVEQTSFCVELMKRLNIQRKQDYFCDITLVTNDDRELKAHRNVLSAASPFFCKLLQSEENREGIIRLEEVSESVLEDVLEFIYSGTVEVTQVNAKELIAAGNYLIIPSLKIVSGRFLQAEMSNTNCISTFYFAEKYDCVELIGNSRKFIYENFAFVGEMDEFLSLEAEEVARWISNDEIVVEAEASVFKIILKWVEHNKSERKAAFEELFPYVRLSLLSCDCLEDVVTNELVRENFACVKLVMDATTKMATFASEDDLPQSPRKGLETRVILACGGKYTYCYLPEKNQWKRLPDGSTERNQKTQMLTFRDQLYIFEKFSKAEKFDPVFNGWSKSDLTDVSVDSAIVTVVKGDIYAIEVNKPVGQSTIKKYNVELCTWQTVVESPQGCRNDSCVVAVGSYLYLLGGSAPGDAHYVAKAERFNTVEKQWEEIADMQQGRGGAFGEVSGGKIFVAGGFNQEGKVSERCEMYNVSTNEWKYIGSLNHGRVYGSMVCLNETLYVLGGSEGSLRAVESYDSTKDKWIETTAVPMNSFHDNTMNTFTCCALKISKGVMDKAALFPNLTGFSSLGGRFGVEQSQTVSHPRLPAFGTSQSGLFGSVPQSQSATGSGASQSWLFSSVPQSQSATGFGASQSGLFGSVPQSQSATGFGVSQSELFRSVPVSQSATGFGASQSGLFGSGRPFLES